MLKRVVISFGIVILLTSCTAKNGDAVNTTTPLRFKFEGNEQIKLTTDSKYGCQYISTSDSRSAWTYVHGSCTDIIMQENGVK